MKPGPKAKRDRPRRWDIYIPGSIAAKVDLLLMNPLTGKIKRGSRTNLITELVQRWLREQCAKELDTLPPVPYNNNKSEKPND
jgi:hypothetical protein